MGTLESNKLIAEFMGAKLVPVYLDGYDDYPAAVWPSVLCYDLGKGLGKVKPSKLRYHSSRDWLMPVVERIAEEVDKLGLSFFNRYLFEEGTEREDFLIFRLSKEETYRAVVEFIRWYNLNSNSNEVRK